MSRYTVLIDGEAGAYGVAIPDCPGCTAMGATIDEAMVNATAALNEWMSDRIAADLAPPIPRAPETLRADPALAESLTTPRSVWFRCCSIPAGPCASTSRWMPPRWRRSKRPRARGLTRSAFLVSAARDKIQAEG